MIKRKPRAVLFETARTCPERISLEYFNGIGWKRLPTVHDYSTLFDGSKAGSISLSFVCPPDWESVAVGGYDERAVRLRITQADNCYLRPCLHNMPVLKTCASATPTSASGSSRTGWSGSAAQTSGI